MTNISVIGLGKLGLPLAASIASKGFFVYGVDVNKKVTDDLNQGKTSLNEPGLQKLITENKSRIKSSDNIQESILNSEMTFIITPTPSKPDGYFSTEYVEKAIKQIATYLKLKDVYHVVVLVSTVMPGSSEEIVKILEKYSGKVCGKDFGFCYNPEFIALGSVIRNLLNPDFILIGESDKKAGDILESFYKKYLDKETQVVRMGFANAELTKISVNTFVTTKISYANMLSEICEKIPGGNVDIVTGALGLDSRIGKKYLNGGASFGGPCFPRDNVAFVSLAKKLKTNFQIAEATHSTNTKQIEVLLGKISKYLSKSTKVGILGLSYKPDTDVIEESMGIHLVEKLLIEKIKINVHDPLSIENVKKIFDDKVNYYSSLEKITRDSDILVVTTNWPEYREFRKEWLIGKKIIIDLWRMIDPTSLPKNIIYLASGINVLKV